MQRTSIGLVWLLAGALSTTACATVSSQESNSSPSLAVVSAVAFLDPSKAAEAVADAVRSEPAQASSIVAAAVSSAPDHADVIVAAASASAPERAPEIRAAARRALRPQSDSQGMQIPKHEDLSRHVERSVPDAVR